MGYEILSKHRQAARVDDNQPQIVSELRKLGFSVETGYDDLIVGAYGKTYWIEIKDPAKALKKDGSFKSNALKDSQKKLSKDFKGNYFIACSTEEILNHINGKKQDCAFAKWCEGLY